MSRWPVSPTKVLLALLAYGGLCYWQWARLYAAKKPGKTRVASWALRDGLVRVLKEDERHVVYVLESTDCVNHRNGMDRLWDLLRRLLHFRN